MRVQVSNSQTVTDVGFIDIPQRVYIQELKHIIRIIEIFIRVPQGGRSDSHGRNPYVDFVPGIVYATFPSHLKIPSWPYPMGATSLKMLEQ